MQRKQSPRSEQRAVRGGLHTLASFALAVIFLTGVFAVTAQESRTVPGEEGVRAGKAPSASVGSGKGEAKGGRSMAEIDRAWMDAIRGSARDSKAPKSAGSGGTSEVGEGARARTGGGEGEGSADGRTLSAGGEKRERLTDPGPASRAAPAPSRMFADGGDDASFLSVVFRFVAILAIMLGGFYLFVRYTRGRNGMGAQTSDLVQVIASVPLIQGRFLQIVDMGGRLLVLGVSDHAVSLLSEVTDARTVDRIRVWQSQNRPGPEQSGGLLGRLTRIIRGTDFRFWNAAAEGARPNAERESFRKLLREQGGSATAPVDFGESQSSARNSGPDLFDFAAPSREQEEESAPDEAELAALLKAQRRRIRALQSKQES